MNCRVNGFFSRGEGRYTFLTFLFFGDGDVCVAESGKGKEVSPKGKEGREEGVLIAAVPIFQFSRETGDRRTNLCKSTLPSMGKSS